MKEDLILIVDDEPSMIELLDYNLKKEGYGVVSAGNGNEALSAFKKNPVSLIILDIMMPGPDGYDVCREIRKDSNVPIIMLTAKSSETNKIVGLELGADDYVVKPFSVGELMARVKAILRRTARRDDNAGNVKTDVIVRGELCINRTKRTVTVRDVAADITTKEFDLLYLLVSNPGVVFTREQILDKVWGNDSYVVDRAVDVHVRHLREKIETSPESPKYIATVRGVGYRFEE
jgi:two-component system, OmpR family, alkaline phosphatase synthesis response regulator PhoP